MSMHSQPVVTNTLASYFHQQLQQVSANFTPTPQEDTLWYMGNMLARFGDSDQLFDADGELKPLALIYQEAQQAEHVWERCLILRHLGDLSLFLGSLFPENYARRGIQQDYFVSIGGGAYDYLAVNARQNRHVFSELATMFSRLLELIAAVCVQQKELDAQSILNLYRRWCETGDLRLAEQLKQLGIVVVEQGGLH